MIENDLNVFINNTPSMIVVAFLGLIFASDVSKVQVRFE